MNCHYYALSSFIIKLSFLHMTSIDFLSVPKCLYMSLSVHNDPETLRHHLKRLEVHNICFGTDQSLANGMSSITQ